MKMNIVNIFNKKRIIYLFIRDNEGKLKIRKDASFYPYYYEPDKKGEFSGFDGTKLKKIIVNEPKEVKEYKSKEAYEADILYCLSPDTWIKMANGNIKQIKDIQFGDIIIAKNHINYYCNKKIIGQWETKKNSYEIATKSQTIIASKDHPFLTISLNRKIDCGKFEWVNTEFLRRNQFLLQWMNYERKPTNYRNDWFYLLGFYFGDGSHFNDNRNDYEMIDKDKENLKTLGRILHKFNIEYEIKKIKQQNSYKLHFNTFNCFELKNKTIPYNFPIEYKLSFIEGIFDSEGSVLEGYCRITNTDEKLIYWISSVLFSIGIPNRILKIKPLGFGKKEVYYLDIYNINKFEKYILTRSIKKYKKLVAKINKADKSKSKNISKFDILPIVNLLKILAFYGKLSGKGWRAKRSHFHSKRELIDFYKNLKSLKILRGLKKNISRILAKKIFNEIKEKALEKGYIFEKLSKQIEFILDNVFCSQITNIKYLGIKKLIDIQVEGENFIANNFASHNCKRYIIDRIDKFDKCPVKWAFLDIEVLKPKDKRPDPLTADFPITSVALYNSKYNKLRNWFIKDFGTDIKKAEIDLFVEFITYLRKAKFDLIMAWYMNNFDYPYCFSRFSKLPQKYFFDKTSDYNNFATAISPIGMVRGGNKEFNNFKPAGISIVDYLEWFKRIYKNEKDNSLNGVMEKYLGRGKEFKNVDFSQITEDIRKRNIGDVRGMVDLEKKFKLIPLYDEIRRMATITFEDFEYPTRIIDSLILREAPKRNIILPSSKGEDNKEYEYEGAYRETFQTGDYYSVSKYDLGCYSGDTEILTEEGWKKYNELKIGEKVATYNININKIQFQSLLHINIQKVKNIEMYNLKNSKTNQLLTWNHRVLFKQTTTSYRNHENNPNSWHIQFAKDVPLHHSLFPLGGTIENKSDYSISDELLQIHAWIITEGHNQKRKENWLNRYYITQSNKKHPEYCKEIDNLFKKLSWKVSKYDRKGLRKGEITWSLNWVYSTYIHLEDNYKIIPLWMLQKLSLRQLNLLFNTLMKGDGNKLQWAYYAKDDLARDRFQYLCCLINRASSNRKPKVSCGVVYCSNEKYTTIIDYYNNKKNGKKKIKYSGIVWCPTTQNGFVVVRRKGKVFISGNSAYPSIIKDLCLDITNITDKENGLGINIYERETGKFIKTVYMKQNPDTILPTIMNQLLQTKDKFKILKKNTNPESPEYENIEFQYEAVKVITNTGYGAFGNKYFRLYNNDIVSLITSVARDLLHCLKDKCKEMGYEVLYVDTDGLIIGDKGKNLSEELNDLIQQWSKERFNKSSSIRIEREGIFEKIFILTMCRYKGWLRTNKGLKEEVKGAQIKRKDSTNFISNFQDTTIEKIFAKATHEDIVEFTKSEMERIRTLPTLDISFPAKLGQKPGDYKTEVTNKKGTKYSKKPPIFVQAYLNTKKSYPEFDKAIGENFYWCYVYNENKEMIPLAFDENTQHYIKDIHWDKMIERNILNIVETIFEAKKWDFSEFKAPKKERKKKINPIEEEIMDLSKLTNEEILKLESKFAGEVSKKTCGTSSSESSVQVANPAPIDKEHYKVNEINSQQTYEWLLYKHYAHRIPQIIHSFGLYYKEKLIGICTFGIPASSFSFNIQPLELNRLVINDDLPKNILSFFVSRTLSLLPQNTIIVSYADSNVGHHGYIYQATNWIYTGKSSPEANYKVNGELMHRKNIYNRYKTSSIPELEKIPQEGKYRYFYLIGGHKFKKLWKCEIISKYGVFPYPKGDNTNYNASYEIKSLDINKKGIIKPKKERKKKQKLDSLYCRLHGNHKGFSYS